jgi:hypothetical protein
MRRALFGLRQLAPALLRRSSLRHRRDPSGFAARYPRAIWADESGSKLPQSKEAPQFVRSVFRTLAISCLLVAAGCGFIADKRRIVIAKMDGKNITRGDLEKYIRDLPDEERPLIQTKADSLETLNSWINDRIKGTLAAQLKKEGKIEVSRDAARERYFQKHPDYRSAYQVQDPSVLEMTQGDLAAVKAEIEFGTDEEVERLLRDEALKYKIYEAIQNKTVTLTADDVHREYDRRKDELIQPEYIEFIALQLPLMMPDAIARAADARRRIDSGEKFDDVVQPYFAQDANFAYKGALQNDPSAARFKSFWETAHGASVGQIIGPVLMPEHDEYTLDPQTQQSVKRTRPAAQLVLEVTKHEAERPKTFEEAANELAGSLARQRVLDRIRAEHGVEIYVEKLYDPAGIGDQYKDSMINTGKPVATTP